MIDTLGFVEFGLEDKALEMWLGKYCDLSALGVSAQEIWELRNSLTHMTNLDSRRVRRGQVKRLLPIVTAPQNDIQVESKDFKYLHTSRLFLSVIPIGLTNWARTLSGDCDKLLDFVRRYDTVVSDTRVSVSPIVEVEVEVQESDT